MTNTQKQNGFKLACLLFILLIGCHKDDTPAVSQPTTGTISGKVTPTNAALNVVATPTSGTTLLVTPDASGNFKFNNVVPSNYTITAIPSTGYGAPTPSQGTVTAGNDLNVGTLQMIFGSTSGSVTYTLDGTNYNVTPPLAYCSFNSPNFLVGSNTAPVNVDNISVSISLNNVNGPGNYVVGNTLSSTIRILQYVGSNIYAWSTLNGGTGSVVITTLNTITHTCSGTFTVNAVAENNLTTGNKTISNGTFSNLIFQ